MVLAPCREYNLECGHIFLIYGRQDPRCRTVHKVIAHQGDTSLDIILAWVQLSQAIEEVGVAIWNESAKIGIKLFVCLRIRIAEGSPFQ